VKQPTILVLDEPTSAIDPISSRLVHATLARVQHGRTAIVVTHELGSVRGFDRILVLESGRIIETGSHGALMNAGPAYRGLSEAKAI
jgi:ABC-type multidrug transport system fused ATPase/permease subunit